MGRIARIAFECLERLLDRDQLQIVAPQLGWIGFAEVGAQQVTAFAPAHLLELVEVEPVAKARSLLGDLDVQQAPGGWDFALRATEFHKQRIARELHAAELLQARP
jgi:hypothetical protein